MERIIDLHIHTTCSDGKLTPFEVLNRAKKNRVSVLSIADHDTIAAYNDELFLEANRLGITIIPAVEISSDYHGVGVHVLGYNFDLNDTNLQEILHKVLNSRYDYFLKVSDKLESLGYKVNKDKLKDVKIITKAHIAEVVTSDIINQEKLLQQFGHIPKKGEFIETIMNENCPAFVEKFKISAVEASKVLHNAGGKVVLAHPVAYKFEDNLMPEKIEELAKKMQVDGIEANYIYIDRFGNEIDETLFWNEFAKKNNYFSTIGSDFHLADDSIFPDIGLINKNVCLSDEEIDLLLKKLTKK